MPTGTFDYIVRTFIIQTLQQPNLQKQINLNHLTLFKEIRIKKCWNWELNDFF